MIRFRSACPPLFLIFLLFGVCNANAQDFLQELFGSDTPPSNSQRYSGRKNDAPVYRSRRMRERDRGHAVRAYPGQSERQDDGARSSRASEGSRTSRGAAGAGQNHDDDGGSWGTGTEFCVRTCDGYFFPLIKSALQTKQASCEYACPSAPVAYYHGSSIETARNLNGEKYTSLPTAFKFREKVSAGCTCHPPEESQEHSLKIVKNDPTAHSGDIVVEQKGAFVYQGKQAVPIDRSRQLSASVRQNIHKMTAGPAPAGVNDPSAQKNENTTTTAKIENDGLLSGAARPMRETDSGVDRFEEGYASSWIMPALLLIGLLSVAAGAVRLLPGLKEHFLVSTIKPKTIDLIDTTEESETLSLPPMAWVWSEYRGVAETGHESPTAQYSRSASVPSTVREIVEIIPGHTAGLSPTSIAWVWSEYRGAV